MTERLFIWSEAGKSTLAAHQVALHEAVEAMTAPATRRVDHWLGATVLVVVGQASTGRVIALYCEPILGTGDSFRIIRVELVIGANLDEWRRRLP